MSRYKWNGEPVDIEFGNCIVAENMSKPLFWYNYECHPHGMACIPAIRVTQSDGASFLISNHFGIGIHKLKNGGRPSYKHFSLHGEFSLKIHEKRYSLKLELFEQHEKDRAQWQRENFPDEWAAYQEKKTILLNRMQRK